MQAEVIQSWQIKIKDAVRRDPKRTGVLVILATVLLVLIGRAAIGNRADTPAAMASTPAGATKKTSASDASFRATNKNIKFAAVQKWLNGSPGKISRNLFAIKLDFYPQVAAKGSGKPGRSNSEVDKSAAEEADVLKEWAIRSEAVQVQARQLKLESTLMSMTPKALISGQMAREGDIVLTSPGESQIGFRVLKIEPRRVIVERDGIKLEILMR